LDHFKASVPLMTEELPDIKGVSLGQEPDAKVLAGFTNAELDRRGSFGSLRCGALVDALTSLLKESRGSAKLSYQQFKERSDSDLLRYRIDPANPAHNRN
jgi:hypothetical protein